MSEVNSNPPRLSTSFSGRPSEVDSSGEPNVELVSRVSLGNRHMGDCSIIVSTSESYHSEIPDYLAPQNLSLGSMEPVDMGSVSSATEHSARASQPLAQQPPDRDAGRADPNRVPAGRPARRNRAAIFLQGFAVSFAAFVTRPWVAALIIVFRNPAILQLCNSDFPYNLDQ